MSPSPSYPPSYHHDQQENGNENEKEDYDDTTMILSNTKDEQNYDYNSKSNFSKNHISFINSLKRYV